VSRRNLRDRLGDALVAPRENANVKAKSGRQHGHAKTNELFRSVQGRIIRRAELAAVAQQDAS
jgi:hypothetical protein